MKVMLFGKDTAYLQRLASLLAVDDTLIMRTQQELGNVCASPQHFPDLVLIGHLIYVGRKKGDVSSDGAISQLREAGFPGKIGACTQNPIINGYLVRLCGADWGCRTDWQGPEEECPQLTVDEVAACIRQQLDQ
jgi:hypothetical protein